MSRDHVFYTAVWLLLVGFTLAAYAIGHQAPVTIAGPPLAIAAGILGIAFLKVAMVMAVFMDLRRAPFPLIAIALAWIMAESVLLVTLLSRA